MPVRPSRRRVSRWCRTWWLAAAIARIALASCPAAPHLENDPPSAPPIRRAGRAWHAGRVEHGMENVTHTHTRSYGCSRFASDVAEACLATCRTGVVSRRVCTYVCLRASAHASRPCAGAFVEVWLCHPSSPGPGPCWSTPGRIGAVPSQCPASPSDITLCTVRVWGTDVRTYERAHGM